MRATLTSEDDGSVYPVEFWFSAPSANKPGLKSWGGTIDPPVPPAGYSVILEDGRTARILTQDMSGDFLGNGSPPK